MENISGFSIYIVYMENKERKRENIDIYGNNLK